MALNYEVKTEKGKTFAAITGFDGEIKKVNIPEYILEDAASTSFGKAGGDSEPRRIPVTEISNRAFASRHDVESITLPDSIMKIRPYAFHNCHHLHYLSLSDNVVDYYDGAIRQCQELQEVEITFYKKSNFRLLKELIGDSDAMVPVLIHFPVDAEHLRADEVLSSLPPRAVQRVNVTDRNGNTKEQVMVTAALTFPSYADNYEEDTFSRAFHEHIEGSGYNTRQLVTRTEIDFSGYDRQFQRFTYDEPASAVNAAFGRLMYPYRLGMDVRREYEEYLREKSPEILPRLIMGYKAERFGHEGELRFIPQDKAITEERIRFMVDEKLISPEAIAPALEASAKEGAITISALLMDYRFSGNGFGPETFEL